MCFWWRKRKTQKAAEAAKAKAKADYYRSLDKKHAKATLNLKAEKAKQSMDASMKKCVEARRLGDETGITVNRDSWCRHRNLRRFYSGIAEKVDTFDSYSDLREVIISTVNKIDLETGKKKKAGFGEGTEFKLDLNDDLSDILKQVNDWYDSTKYSTEDDPEFGGALDAAYSAAYPEESGK